MPIFKTTVYFFFLFYQIALRHILFYIHFRYLNHISSFSLKLKFSSPTTTVGLFDHCRRQPLVKLPDDDLNNAKKCKTKYTLIIFYFDFTILDNWSTANLIKFMHIFWAPKFTEKKMITNYLYCHTKYLFYTC